MAWRQIVASISFVAMTSMGIAIATAIVTATLSLGTLGLETTKSFFEEMRLDVIQVNYTSMQSRDALDLQHADIMALAQAIPHAANAIKFSVTTVDSVDGNTTEKMQVVAGGPQALQQLINKADTGRLPYASEFDQALCLIDADRINARFARGVSLNNRSFALLGTFQVRGQLKQAVTQRESVAFIPEKISASLSDTQPAHFIHLQLTDSDFTHVEEAKLAIEHYFVTHYPSISAYTSSPWDQIRSTKELVEKINLMVMTIGIIVAILSCISMSNAMLMSIAHRRAEIGTRLAIGARPNDLAMQFFFEAVIITSFGILTGWLVSIVGVWGWCAWSGWVWEIVPFAFMLTAIAGILCAIGGGVWPAIKAARVEPMEVLRT